MANTSDRNRPMSPSIEVVGPEVPATPLPEAPLSEPMGRDDDELVDTTAFAHHMGVSPQAIRNHLLQNRVIGWRIRNRGLVLPLNQLCPNNRYIPNLPRLLQIIPEPAEAWYWLTRPNLRTARERPLGRLHAGHTEEVLLAARQYIDGAFT